MVQPPKAPKGKGRVRFNGRWVSRAWYFRYVLNGGKPQPYKPPVPIIARFYLPAIQGTADPEQFRVVDLNRSTDREWVRDISDCYAMPPATELPTFFKPPFPRT